MQVFGTSAYVYERYVVRAVLPDVMLLFLLRRDHGHSVSRKILRETGYHRILDDPVLRLAVVCCGFHVVTVHTPQTARRDGNVLEGV